MNWLVCGVVVTVSMQMVDWAFFDAQERFIVESAGLPAVYRSLDSESRSLLASMAAAGEGSYRHREWASRAMLAKGDAHACYVGQFLGDPEVRLRCRNILRKMSECRMCEGKGGCERIWGLEKCQLCNQIGHYWPLDDMTPWLERKDDD